MALLDPTPGPGTVALFVLGWACGWVLLWRPRPLPAPGRRPPVAVVVPARDEAHALPHLLGALARREGDELVVVDDHSGDATAAVASAHGAAVVPAPPLPPGWAGKPHACWVGALATTAPVLVFLDADVRPAAPDLLDRLAGVADGELVSVQPWHHTEAAYEQLSLLFSITAVMGSSAFTPLGERVRPGVAFGPVLACTRATYEAAGGHAAVRAAVAEDIALGRRVGRVRLHTGRPAVSFRMYPDGVRSLVQGWTKNIATGAASIRWWFALAVVGWIWSLAGGWLASPWFYAASAVQLAVQGRRVGRVRAWAVLAYPLVLVFFLAVFLRSVALTARGRTVRWKGRDVATRG